MLESYRPQELFSIFERYCAIPHGSRNTAAATEFCLRYAKDHGLAASSDAAGNVVIRVPATPGYERAPTVILQGHLDMVDARDADCRIDMTTEGLSLLLEGDLIGARGTTLGGDDGVAIAIALAILADKSLPHPALEAVFTTDEEIGMYGAVALDMSSLRGRYMINIDSEEEGVLTVSCAGGATTTISYPVCRETVSGEQISVSLFGLAGGHSGTEIHRGRANAIRLLAELLYEVGRVTPLRLVHAEGGEKDNAIPTRASCCFFADDPVAAERAARAFLADRRAACAATDPDMDWSLCRCRATAPAVTAEDTRVFCQLLCELPCGVQSMSPDMAELPLTSLSVGILRMGEGSIEAVYSVRSAVGGEQRALLSRMEGLADAAGAACRTEGAYPAWEYKRSSPLRDTVCDTYRRLFSQEMAIKAVHAGLECGIFCDGIPGLDCVSLGPNMQDIHTTRERLSASSMRRTYELICAVLAAIR